jgi:iron(III) transport system substrate-binding protein
MQEAIGAFKGRFPFLRIDLVRASGSQLITRVQAEAGAGVLAADVIDHSDRALIRRLENLFADYAPPNGGAFLPAALCSPKLWPTIAPGWCIAVNVELQPELPRSWWDLCKSAYRDGRIGQVIGVSGGTTWTRIMFERQVLGEDYWPKQAALKPRLFPSSAPLADALVRGEVSIAPIIYDAIFPALREGAPLKALFAQEGVPIAPYAAGIPKTAAHPHAARLFLDWQLSEEGQRFAVTRHGNFSMLKAPPAVPSGFDPRRSKIWVPDFGQSEALHDAWVAAWSQVYHYRQ